MSEYSVDMYITLKVSDVLIEADSPEEAKRIISSCDIFDLEELGATFETDEIYDVQVTEMEDDVVLLSESEIDDIFDELVAIEKENFEENQEFDSVADDYEEFSDYMIDKDVYDSAKRQSLWTKFKKELDKIVKEYTALADEE